MYRVIFLYIGSFLCTGLLNKVLIFELPAAQVRYNFKKIVDAEAAILILDLCSRL